MTRTRATRAVSEQLSPYLDSHLAVYSCPRCIVAIRSLCPVRLTTDWIVWCMSYMAQGPLHCIVEDMLLWNFAHFIASVSPHTTRRVSFPLPPALFFVSFFFSFLRGWEAFGFHWGSNAGGGTGCCQSYPLSHSPLL